jgi:hypothetical protein
VKEDFIFNAMAEQRWASEHHEELNKRGSSLAFQLHRLRFIKLLETSNMEALYYGRTHFDEFADRHLPGNYTTRNSESHPLLFSYLTQRMPNYLQRFED